MSTTYGTIPTSTPPSSMPLDFISRAKARGLSALDTRKPWRELADIHAFSFPPSLGEAYLRVRANAAYFAMNYAIVVHLVVFLSLLWHPFSLIVFVVMLVLWLFLYFLREREDPLIVYGYVLGEATILVGLSVLTLVVLLLTGAITNILVSLILGLLVVLIHAVLRKTEDLEEYKAPAGGHGVWISAVASGPVPHHPSPSAPIKV